MDQQPEQPDVPENAPQGRTGAFYRRMAELPTPEDLAVVELSPFPYNRAQMRLMKKQAGVFRDRKNRRLK